MEKNSFAEPLKALPSSSGVYLFKDSSGKVLYVGKAVNLRNRVRSYFAPSQGLTPKLRRMMEAAADLDFIVTDSELEAIILESNLIKKYRPHFNVRLKDDKSYPYIKVTLNEEWPRVFLTRRFEDDGGRYFGPFPNAASVRSTLELLKGLFPYCSPRSPITGRRPRPCFDYYIGRCAGACSGEISREEYRAIVDQVILFLEGKHDAVLRDLKKEMERAAANMAYEKAAALRDRIDAVKQVTESQKMVSVRREDRDLIAVARERNEACAQVFFIRGGRLVGTEHFILEGAQDEESAKVTGSFISQFYAAAGDVPPEVLVAECPEDAEALQSWLSSKRGKRVRLVSPRRGRNRILVDMVVKNAVEVLEQRHAKWLADSGKTAAAMTELQERLALPGLPNRIECYDISNIRGTSAVGSMVVFEAGRPRPPHYRRFQIKGVEGIDDYAMMREVLRRRFKRFGENDGSSWATAPDLVLIDGGRGHLTAALQVLRDSDADSVPVASIAKENEGIFLPGRAEPVRLPKDSQALYLVQRVRDAAHRFAVSYHQRVRRKAAVSSALDIPGIGPKRRKALLKHFGSVRRIRDASMEEISSVPGMTRPLAKRVKEYL